MSKTLRPNREIWINIFKIEVHSEYLFTIFQVSRHVSQVRLLVNKRESEWGRGWIINNKKNRPLKKPLEIIKIYKNWLIYFFSSSLRVAKLALLATCQYILCVCVWFPLAHRCLLLHLLLFILLFLLSLAAVVTIHQRQPTGGDSGFTGGKYRRTLSWCTHNKPWEKTRLHWFTVYWPTDSPSAAAHGRSHFYWGPHE